MRKTHGVDRLDSTTVCIVGRLGPSRPDDHPTPTQRCGPAAETPPPPTPTTPTRAPPPLARAAAPTPRRRARPSSAASWSSCSRGGRRRSTARPTGWSAGAIPRPPHAAPRGSPRLQGSCAAGSRARRRRRSSRTRRRGAAAAARPLLPLAAAGAPWGFGLGIPSPVRSHKV
jgi:hypothetical protein